jgi:hypothetical protein
MNVLTRDDLRSIAPSIFTASPYHTMTPRYRVAHTADAVDVLERIGLFPVRAQQSRTRTPTGSPTFAISFDSAASRTSTPTSRPRFPKSS